MIMLTQSFKNSFHFRKIARLLFLAIFLFSCVSIDKNVGLTMIEFYQAYNPIFEKDGISLKIRYINSARENITVEKDRSEWTITIYDGFIRHPKINRNGLRIAVCHEIGHLLAEREENAMYASERDSDAYAIKVCGRAIGMKTEQLKDGIESVYQWYKLFPVMQKYPDAIERRDIMIVNL